MQDETAKAVSVVEDGTRKTADGTAVVEQTREAFLSIGQAVDDMVARVEQIAAAGRADRGRVAAAASVAEQSSASTEQVSASTEETSASTEQIAASAQELASNADELNRLMRQFKVAES